MTDQTKRGKKSSIAAFLFMPQFGLSFQHMSFIVPVFIRTIGVMFAQAGLLPEDHPSTKYGMEGVRKYRLTEILGEAFYTLRAQKGNMYQWSMFASVVMMIVFTILSVITTLMHMAGIFVSSASAQIFDHPAGDSGFDTVPPASGAMVDWKIEPTGPHGDYGIMILDKMLRQGADFKGGPLQNALGGLMQIYNTGVLVVAGIMLFWIVLSVVVDTAKTGQIGGGRHNMVWAPIRIVFALGLLIPLGSSGFSSGQFAIMKLAEWGSNLGTRGWITYVEGVVKHSNMVAYVGIANPTSVVNQYAQMWVCRTAYNGYTYQSVTDPKPEHIIIQTSDIMTSSNPEKINISFTNETVANLCGTITLPTVMNRELQRDINIGDPIERAAAIYKREMILANASLFTASLAAPEVPGLLNDSAKSNACAFVSQHIFSTSGASPLSPDTVCGGDGGGLCGAGAAGSGNYPNTSCLEEMVKTASNTLTAAADKAWTDLASAPGKPEFLKSLKDRGWASMGVWYHRIAQLNRAANAEKDMNVSISSGTVLDPGMMEKAGSALVGAITGEATHKEKVREVMTKYVDWWQQAVPTSPSSETPEGSARTDQLDAADKIKSVGVSDLKALAGASASQTATKLLGWLGNPVDLFYILDNPKNENLYPLAVLENIGSAMITSAVTIFVAPSVIGFLLSFVPMLSPAVAFLTSPFVQGLVTSLASAMMLAGLVLAIYIPLIPMLRAAFAVLTWMISVFEAVVMVPIAALAHLTTEGEGLAGGAKQAWILWLNVLLRPILTVIGFVAAMIIFNTFIIYFHAIFIDTMKMGLSSGDSANFFSKIIYSIIYVFVMYTAANTTFKLLDMMPNAMMRYLGGSVDPSFDQDNTSNFIAAASVMSKMQPVGKLREMSKPKDKDVPSTTDGGGGGGGKKE